jgi:hypothetical protein
MKTLNIDQVIDPRIVYFTDVDNYLAFCKNNGIKPTIDYTRGTKHWIGPAGFYTRIDSDGNYVDFSINERDGQSVTIFGIPKFTPLQDKLANIPTSDATYSIIPGTEYPFGNDKLASLLLESEVMELCRGLILDGLICNYGLTKQFGITWRTDSRRFYTLTFDGLKFDAGYIYALRHRFGIDCPGTWFMTDNGPNFVPMQFKEGPQGNIWDTPVKLPDNYEVVIQANLMGKSIIIREKEAETTSGSSLLTEYGMIKYLYDRAKAEENKLGRI